MISQITFGCAWVNDTDQAIDFYVNKLGFEKTQDQPMDDQGHRWVEVRPPGAQTGLVLAAGFGDDNPQARVGAWTGMVFRSEHVQATYDQLKARGVEFSEPPTMQPWGEYWTTFVDQDGNGYGLGGPA